MPQANKRDLTNAAYREDYLAKRRTVIDMVRHPANKTKTQELQGQKCTRTIEEYRVMQSDKRYSCSRNLVFDESGAQIHEYISLYHHPFFCDRIEHSNRLVAK